MLVDDGGWWSTMFWVTVLSVIYLCCLLSLVMVDYGGWWPTMFLGFCTICYFFILFTVTVVGDGRWWWMMVHYVFGLLYYPLFIYTRWLRSFHFASKMSRVSSLALRARWRCFAPYFRNSSSHAHASYDISSTWPVPALANQNFSDIF